MVAWAKAPSTIAIAEAERLRLISDLAAFRGETEGNLAALALGIFIGRAEGVLKLGVHQAEASEEPESSFGADAELTGREI